MALHGSGRAAGAHCCSRCSSARARSTRGFWIDEGISVGIAHQHWTSIPHVLRQDGSPPAYYLLLGLWIRVFGDSERATHALSLVFALACIPLAYFAARARLQPHDGPRRAMLAALDPFLTYYAQETRMYKLEAFLSLLVAWSYVRGDPARRSARGASVFVPSRRAARLHAQLGALRLRRPRRRDGARRA